MNESETYNLEKKIYDLLPHDPETMATCLFIIAMAAYYLWRTLAITPQYDELYTYYTFISRGPFYAAIHWPLPNNHVGYSVLSGFLNYFGNPYFGLRGVSLFCAVVNLILIYKICKKYFYHGMAFGAVVLYSSMQIVNEYSTQGRGYTLGCTCFLIALYVSTMICTVDEIKGFYYAAMTFAFVLGLYTVPTSVYWVLPVSFAVFVYLAVNAYKSKEYHEKISDSIYFRKLKRFVLHGILAIFITLMLYGIIWLAIGSNLLVKTEGSEFYNSSHFVVLLRAPLKSLLTGVDYMLNQPYIQSLSPEDFSANCLEWGISLFRYMLPGFEYIIPVVIIMSFVIALYECIKHFAYSRTVVNMLIMSNVLITGLLLFIQRKLPYLRVFSYGAVILTFCICYCIEIYINIFVRLYNRKNDADSGNESNPVVAHKENETTIRTGKWYLSLFVYIPVLLIIILFVIRFNSSDFSCQLADRETDVLSTLYIADVEKKNNIAVLDCDQQYLLKFGWDIDCDKTDVDGADCVIIDKNLTSPGYSGYDFWKFYQSYETINWDYIATMRPIYENEGFILYVK